MIAWIKAVHILSLAVWCAGLIALPTMLFQRRALAGEALYHVQHATRFVFVTLVSPLAFVAIGTGTVLVFAQETFTAWFAVKLLLIGFMAKLHIRLGSAVVEVFKEEGRYSGFRTAFSTVVACVLVTGVLVVVLLKPELSSDLVPASLTEPGALRELLRFDQLSSSITMPMP